MPSYSIHTALPCPALLYTALHRFAFHCSAKQGLDILVATPGRMLAHLTETRGIAQLCAGVKVLILDEADRLLDMGFKR